MTVLAFPHPWTSKPVSVLMLSSGSCRHDQGDRRSRGRCKETDDGSLPKRKCRQHNLCRRTFLFRPNRSRFQQQQYPNRSRYHTGPKLRWLINLVLTLVTSFWISKFQNLPNRNQMNRGDYILLKKKSRRFSRIYRQNSARTYFFCVVSPLLLLYIG